LTAPWGGYAHWASPARRRAPRARGRGTCDEKEQHGDEDAHHVRDPQRPLAESREKLIDLLNARLADSFDLYSQLKQAHWSVRGPDFIQLHELYDTVAESVLGFVDEIAERATSLGGLATGTVRMAAEASALDEYPLDATSGPDTMNVVADRLAAYGAAVREAIETADSKLGDMDTSDLFTEISRAIDKHLWFVEAHHQSDA
jgi:starvation-inducible DNA-binding protein